MSSIRDTAAIRDYHELDEPGFEDPNAIEKRLAEVETQLATGLARVMQYGIATREIHASVVQLVALLRVRVPAFKAHVDAFLEQIVRSVGLIMERSGQLPPVPKGLEDVLRVENLSSSISNWKCLEFMLEAAGPPIVVQIRLLGWLAFRVHFSRVGYGDLRYAYTLDLTTGQHTLAQLPDPSATP